MKKIISAAIAAQMVLAASGGFMTASARTVSDIVQVPLSFFDNDSDWRAETSSYAAIPNAFMGNLDLASFESETRKWGGDLNDPISAKKEADDSYLYYKLRPDITFPAGKDNVDKYFEIVSYRSPMNRVALEAGDENIITVSMDIATSNINSKAYKEVFNTETNASMTSSKTNKWTQAVYANNSTGKIGTAQLESGQWYNVTVELGGETATGYKYYVDGVYAGEGTLESDKPNLGLIRVGVKAYKNTADGSSYVDDMAFDNLSLRVGEPFSQERYNADKTAKNLHFSDICGSNTDKTQLTENLNLITALPEDESGSVISWSSDKPEVISNDGVVTRGADTEDVILTASVTNGTKTTTKDFYVSVLRLAGVPDTETDFEALTDSVILNGNSSLENITKNLYLPTAGASGNTAITWTSSDEAAVSADGTVTGGADYKNVTLTASISKEGDETLTKIFNLTIAPDFDKVDKAELQKLVTAADEILAAAESFTAESYAEFENIYYEASDIAYSTGYVQSVVDEEVIKFRAAIENLIYAGFPAVETNGVVTKDTFAQKGKNGNPTDVSLVAKHLITEEGESTARRAFIGFDVSGIDPASNKVTLELYVSQLGANNTFEDSVMVYGVGNNWTESGLTWANKPMDYTSKPLDSFGPFNIHSSNENYNEVKGYKSFDVTDYVMEQKAKGASEVSFAVASGFKSGSSYIIMGSRESDTPPLLKAEKRTTVKTSITDDLDAIFLPPQISEAGKIELVNTGAVNSNTITWTTTNPEVISADGTVTLPEVSETVTLTASGSAYGLTFTREFVITVKTVSDEEAACSSLTFDDIKGNNTIAEDIKYNLNLVSEGANGIPITWSSSDESFITSDGIVTRNVSNKPAEVTLTAAAGKFTKEFKLRVSGDYYVNDDCTGFDNVVEVSDKLKISKEETWRVEGVALAMANADGQYMVYSAAEGAGFEVETVINNIGSNRLTFFISEDNVNYVPFADVTEEAEKRPIGEYGGYSYLRYKSSRTLPEGTRYLKLVVPKFDKTWRHWITDVKINIESDEISFNDIKGNNLDMNNITENLILPVEFNNQTIEWTSDSGAILSDGTFIRPEQDTDVKLTAAVTNNGITTTKEYKLTAKAYDKNIKVLDKPFVWFMSDKNLIAGVRADSTFSGLRNDGTVNKLYVTSDVINNTGAEKNVIMSVVVYDTSGHIINVSYDLIPVGVSSQPQQLKKELTLTETADYTLSNIKSFVWDADTMLPLIEAFNVHRTK